jgi:hypothetical protein
MFLRLRRPVRSIATQCALGAAKSGKFRARLIVSERGCARPVNGGVTLAAIQFAGRAAGRRPPYLSVLDRAGGKYL